MSVTACNDDKNHLKAIIDGCYDKEVKRASNAIVSALSETKNAMLREEVAKNALQVEAKEKDCMSEGAVLEGIKSTFVHLKSTTSRKAQAEVMVKNVAAACMFTIGQQNKPFSNAALQKCLGISNRQLALARRNVLQMIENDQQGVTVERRQQSDYIRAKLAPYVYDYIKDCDVTHLDTNQGHVEGVDPRTGLTVTEHMRIWNEVNKDQQRKNFLDSTYYHDFRQENEGATAVSYGVWNKEVLSRVGWFVCDPTQRSCVDEKISGFEHVNRALGEVLKRNRIKTGLEAHESPGGLSYEQTCCVVNQTSAFAMVDAVCCEKGERPDIHIDKDQQVPRFIPFLCTHGGPNGSKCHCCGIKKKLSILQPLRDPSTEADEDKVDVKV